MVDPTSLLVYTVKTTSNIKVSAFFLQKHAIFKSLDPFNRIANPLSEYIKMSYLKIVFRQLKLKIQLTRV